MNQKILIRDTPAEVVNLLRCFPLTFTGALVCLMKWRNITVEALAEKALTSRSTIIRLRNDPNYETTVDVVVALSIALELSPALYYLLLQVAGLSFKAIERHVAFQQLLPLGLSIHQFNEALIHMGFAPVGMAE
jgi:hypothetical protein